MDIHTDTFTHDGKNYDLGKVRLLVRPEKSFLLHTKELIWVLNHDEADEERVKKAKLRYPLLVARWRGKWTVVDGLHRLTKYNRLGFTVLPVKHVTEEMLRLCEIRHDTNDSGGVELIPEHKKSGNGSGPGGEFWKIVVQGKRVGMIFVNVINEPPVGQHASMQIYLNQPDQGKGIGTIAYRKAFELTKHRCIYLHMRKSNPASKKAAMKAGFVDVSPPDYRQLILKKCK